MAIAAGEKIPSVTLKRTDMSDISTEELFGGRKVVVFAVPGAFTPTCSNQHLPGYIAQADAIKAKGVDEIVCLSVNDAFVMGAWGKDRGADDKVRLVADGNGDLTKALGLEMDGSGIGFGLRSQRFAAIIDDGKVTKLAVEEPMKFEVSAAEAILAALSAWRERTARSRDKPRNWILDDKACVQIASRQPENLQQLKASVDRPPPVLRRHGEEIIEVVVMEDVC